jgi:hypothetical protein
MYIFVLLQRAAEMLLQDLAMLGDLSAVDSFDDIAIFVDTPLWLSLSALGALKGNLGLRSTAGTQVWLASHLVPLTETCPACWSAPVSGCRKPSEIFQWLLLVTFGACLQQGPIGIGISVSFATASQMACV